MSELVGIGQPIEEGGLTELVGADEQVDQNEFGGSVGVNLVDGTAVQSGEILGITLIRTGGTMMDPAGKLIILDADPATTPGDADLTAAEWRTILGIVNVADTDWAASTNGAAVCKEVNIPYPELPTL